MKLKFIIVGILIMGLSSCSSVAKFNTQITKKNTVAELKEDVDFAYKKLKKLHPDLDLYISKDSLDNGFNSFKNGITKPLTSREFYSYFAPAIAMIKQGHTSIYPRYKKLTKKEKKLKLFKSNPFRKLRFSSLNHKIFITKNFSKDSTILEGSELLKIDNNPISDLIKSYRKILTGDGYNKTYVPMAVQNHIGSLYIRTHGLKDSISLTLRKKDSIYTKFIYSLPKHKKKKKSKSIAKKKLTKSKKKLAKKKKKERENREYKYGYNKITKENTRNFKFINIDSNCVAGYLKIRGFGNGGYKDFYLESFAKLDSANCKNLIIDLRNNGGGRLSEIAHLYSYLTDKEYTLINPSKMTKRSSWLYPFSHSKSILKKSAVYALFPIAKIAEFFIVKKVDGVSYLRFGSSKVKKPSAVHNYKGKVYVLINPLSFSASCILSNQLKANGAFLVGNETGGANNSTVAGIFAPIELPNSKLILRFGIASLDTKNKDNPDGYGVLPNKYIKITTLDKDEPLDWILDTIKNTENQ